MKTIIECLRYICTGEFPPGFGKSGIGFVHDPKLCKLPEVRAQIKLKFCDENGEKVIAIRSMIVKQKGKQQKFQSLEGTIKRKKQGSDEVSAIFFLNEIFSVFLEVFQFSLT